MSEILKGMRKGFESDEERLKSGSQNADIQMAINSVTSLKQALSSEDQKVTQLTKELESTLMLRNHKYIQ